MKLLNRNAVLAKAQQPYLDWLEAHATDYDPQQPPSAVYLLDETKTFAKQEKLAVLHTELFSWNVDEKLWPKQTIETFDKWFLCSPIEAVLDLGEEELLSANLVDS